MTELNPPYALQNAGATHTAAGDRSTLGGIFAGASRGGVNGYVGTELQVTQTGSPSMGVLVGSGIVFVPGTESGTQGTYGCVNDNTVTLTVSTAHGTLPRVDSVFARVKDSQYSGAVDSWALEVVAGTASASPASPTAPNNSIRLANISVGAAVTSITNANITDVRPWATALGGIFVVRNQFERDAIVGAPGGYSPVSFRTDTGLVEINVGGTWYPKSPMTPQFSNQNTAPALVANGVWNDFTSPQWTPITFTMPQSGMFTVSIGAHLQCGTANATTWVAYRGSGGSVFAASGATGAGQAGIGIGGKSREFLFSGGTPGASTTITPQYQLTSGASGVITLGQMRVRLEN